MKKSKIILSIGITLCLILLISFVLAYYRVNLTAKDPLTKKDFEISGLVLGENISKISKALGKPNKVINKEGVISYYYPNLVVRSFLLNGPQGIIKDIDAIEVTDPKIKTYRGISVGDKENDVIIKYGKKSKNLTRLIYEDSYDYDTYVICFDIEKGKVIEIILYSATD